MKEITLEETVRKYGELHKEIKAAKAKLDELTVAKEATESLLRFEMEEYKFDKLTVDNITVYVRDDIYISMPKGDDNAIAWLINHDLGDLPYLYVPSQTLSAVIKEKAADNPDILEEVKKIFNVSEKPRVGIRVAKE